MINLNFKWLTNKMSYQLYRNTTLGNTLQESLDELIQVRKCEKFVFDIIFSSIILFYFSMDRLHQILQWGSSFSLINQSTQHYLLKWNPELHSKLLNSTHTGNFWKSQSTGSWFPEFTQLSLHFLNSGTLTYKF